MLGIALLAAPPAGASFHLNKIREITGDTLGGQQSYIELQMYASGENFVSGHSFTFWDDDGLVMGVPQPIATRPLAGANPPNGESQRTILIGDTGVANADFVISDLDAFLEDQLGSDLTQAGAVCWQGTPIDCVSWGGSNFTGAANLPDGTTPNGSTMPTGVLALHRNIGGGTCGTALEAADDTNDAAADFSLVGANPRPNSVAPTEMPCVAQGTPTPATPVTPGKKRKCKKRKRATGTGGGAPAYAAKKKCKKKRK